MIKAVCAVRLSGSNSFDLAGSTISPTICPHPGRLKWLPPDRKLTDRAAQMASWLTTT